MPRSTSSDALYHATAAVAQADVFVAEAEEKLAEAMELLSAGAQNATPHYKRKHDAARQRIRAVTSKLSVVGLEVNALVDELNPAR